LGRREQKREATRQDILAAAKELFQKKGYDETSIDDIVLSADLAKGTFYYHFESKEELLADLQEAVLSKSIDAARQKMAKGASPIQLLIEFVAEAAHWTEENPEFARAIIRQKSAQFTRGAMGGSQGKDCAKTFPQHSFPALVLDLLKQAQKVGEIRSDVETAELAGLVMPVIMHAKARWLFTAEGSLPALLERRLKLLIEGLKPPKRPSPAD
jgi:AcrR family transcriptional regulator